MHKSVTMDWIRRNVVESEKKENVIIRECIISTKVWMILLGMQTGEVISGLMIEGSDKICVAYGKNCHGEKMNVIGI